MKERLARMNERSRETESRILQRRLKEYLGDGKRTITAYMPLSDEPDIRPLMNEWMTAGWSVALPAVEGNVLVFRTVKSLEEAQRNPLTRLTEPPSTNPPVDRKNIDIVLVPGRAFTRDGKRLGRGNGGYDRWIAEQRNINPQTTYIGLCFECQIVIELPLEPHDERMDAAITAQGKV